MRSMALKKRQIFSQKFCDFVRFHKKYDRTYNKKKIIIIHHV